MNWGGGGGDRVKSNRFDLEQRKEKRTRRFMRLLQKTNRRWIGKDSSRRKGTEYHPQGTVIRWEIRWYGENIDNQSIWEANSSKLQKVFLAPKGNLKASEREGRASGWRECGKRGECREERETVVREGRGRGGKRRDVTWTVSLPLFVSSCKGQIGRHFRLYLGL